MTEQFIGSWVELELQDGLKMRGIVQHIDINTKTMNMTSVTAYQNGQSFNALTCTVPGDKILNLEFSSDSKNLSGKAGDNKEKVNEQQKPNANIKSNKPAYNNNDNNNNNKGPASQARAYQNLDGSYVGIGTNNGNQNNNSYYGKQYQPSLDVKFDDQALYKQNLFCEEISDQENIKLNQNHQQAYDYSYQKGAGKQSQNLYQQPRNYINNNQENNGYNNQSNKGYYNQNDNYLHPPTNQHRNIRDKHHNNHYNNHQNDKNIISDNNDSDYLSNDNRSNKYNKNKNNFRKNKQKNHHSKHKSFGYGSEWASDDVSEYKEDFDFQSNLLLFDKKKVLEEIRANDTTAPGTLLVDINKKGQQQQPSAYKDPHYHDDYHQRLVKLRPDENVLSLDEREKAPGEFSDDDMLQPELNDLKITGSQLKTVTGVSCPTVNKEQMLEAIRLAVYEMGISEKQLIENGGFSISIMLLKAIGGARRLNPDNHNSCPVMVVLAGNNSTGAFSLCAAKHMSNHGVSVMTFIACKYDEMIESVAHQQAQLATFGVKELSSMSDLPSHLVSPVDIILDGLLGYEFMLHEVTVDHERVLIADLIDWANANKAPVLSLELASGACNTAAGTGFSPTTTTITPKWTLCLGATKEGLKDRNTSGEVFLADMGLPHCIWKQAGVKGWKPPFGHEFVQSLEFL